MADQIAYLRERPERNSPQSTSRQIIEKDYEVLNQIQWMGAPTDYTLLPLRRSLGILKKN